MSRQHVPQLIHHDATLLHVFRGGFTASLSGRGKCQVNVIKKTQGALDTNDLVYKVVLNDGRQETKRNKCE